MPDVKESVLCHGGMNKKLAMLVLSQDFVAVLFYCGQKSAGVHRASDGL